MDTQTTITPLNHLAAQLLACTVSRFLPNVLLAGGGTDFLGFYYDFVLEQPLTESMLDLIEVQLRTLIKEDHEISFLSMMRENAESLFTHHRQPLLAQLAAEEELNIIELMQCGDFYGLCPALTLTTTQEAGHIKLLDSQPLTRWIDDEEMSIIRIRGTSQRTFKDLKNFLKKYDLYLKKKDHRKLGPQLNLFSFSERMGPLGPVWHPKGMKLRQILQNWLDQQIPWQEQPISTPSAVRQEFLLASSPSRDTRFQDTRALAPFIFDDEEFQLVPSLLAQHIEFLKMGAMAQCELPWRLHETAPVYHAVPESLRWGLLNACSHPSDWSTICCTSSQVLPELISSLHFIEQIITIFRFEAQWTLIASRNKTPKARLEQEAIQSLTESVRACSLHYPFSSELEETDEQREGPRLELRVRDALGREWVTGSLGIVVHLPEVRSLRHNQSSLAVLTRQVWGSIDRVIALLIEQHEGILPLWMAPEQARVLAVGSGTHDYAGEVCRRMQSRGLRAGLDLRDLPLGEKVHAAEKENIPYLVLVGDRERAKGGISVRMAEKPGHNQFVELEAFLDKLYQECLSPTIKEAQG